MKNETRLHSMDFHEVSYLRIFFEKIQVWIKYDTNNGYSAEDVYTFMVTS